MNALGFKTAAAVILAHIGMSAFAQTPPPGDDAFFPGPPPGGPGPMMREELKILSQFDKDGDHQLNSEERKAARAFAQQNNKGRGPRGPGGRGRPPGGPGGFGPRAENSEPAKPGPQVSPGDVALYPKEAWYATNVIRTLFLTFENKDWEKELSDFHGTDVDVPATLSVDGTTLRDVGVRFRGMSSYAMVSEGRKRSLNLSLDFVHKDQNVQGFRTFNLLNSHEDPSFLRSVLFAQASRDYLPAPRANWVKVVINGESWGLYINVEQFNKDFIQHWFGTTQGARWKVPGSPQGQGSLAYLGDDPEPYKKIYSIKSKDKVESWKNLIHLCKVLNQTPSNQLVTALSPLLDIEGALRFLALENALVNNDGYWTRTSDYDLYQDTQGRFHVLPHDINEAFNKPGGPGPGGPGGPGRGPRGPRPDNQSSDGRDSFGPPGFNPPGGPGGPEGRPPRPEGFDPQNPQARPEGPQAARAGGPRPGRGPRINGVELDPLYAANDAGKPLISKLLAVPELRARYLALVREIADRWLDWEKLGPMVRQYHGLIEKEVHADTRKLDSTEDFDKSLLTDIPGKGGGPGGEGSMALKNFADQRRAYLIKATSGSKP